jgi:hypothetical protein
MKNLSDEELIRRISNAYKYEFVTEEEDIAELLYRLTKGRKAILAMEKIREECRMNALVNQKKCCSKLVVILDDYDKE